MEDQMAHMRFHAEHSHLASAFGPGRFGEKAEAFARFFGTPIFLITQTVIVVGWIVINAAQLASYDPYPFILLNLAFSLQAAYAAPLILLAQTRQADREKAHTEADARHREELSRMNMDLLQKNTQITEQVAQLAARIDQLTREIHGKVLSE
jgi:uncharacterized membrane protein